MRTAAVAREHTAALVLILLTTATTGVYYSVN